MKNSKKLLTAVAALVVALAVSVGSTFAWFTTNKRVVVEGITANVTTGDANLEVAFVYDNDDFDGHEKGEIGDFGYSIDLSDYLEETLKNLKFDHLTDNGALAATSETSAGTWAGSGKNGAALTGKDGKATSAICATDEVEGNYLQFTLRFRTTTLEEGAKSIPLKLVSDEKVSYITSEKGKKTPNIFPNKEIKDGETTAAAMGQPIVANAKDATRVAVHPATVVEPTEEGGNGDVTVSDNGYVWNPNVGEGMEVFTTINMAQEVEAQLTGKTTTYYAGIYKDPEYADLAEDAEYVVGTMKEVGDFFVVDVTFIVWIEGTDADCFNNIFDHSITINMSFELGEVAKS